MRNLFFTLFLIFLCSVSLVFAQQNKIDSLEKVLTVTQSDTAKIDLLILIAEKYTFLEARKNIEHGQKGLEIAQKLNDTKRIGTIYYYMGRGYWQKGVLDSALYYFQRSLKIAEQRQDFLQIAKNTLNMGFVYRGIGDIGIASRQTFMHALFMFEKLESNEDIISCLNSLGWQHVELGTYDSAEIYLQKALSIGIRIKSENLAIIYDNLGENQFRQKKYEKALFYLEKSLELAQKIGNKRVQSAVFRILAEIDLVQNRIENADQKSLKALNLAQELNSRQKTYETYQTRSKVLFAKKDFENAYQYKDLFILYRDSMQGQATKNALKVFDYKREQEKVKQYETEKEQQRIFNILLFFILFLLSILTITFFRSRKKIQSAYSQVKKAKEEISTTLEIVSQQKEEIHKRNEDVTASITYAKRIQTAILPFEERFGNSLGKDNFFILFRPKDIVSGDFYWFEEVQTQTETIKFIAVADCTGQGMACQGLL